MKKVITKWKQNGKMITKQKNYTKRKQNENKTKNYNTK